MQKMCRLWSKWACSWLIVCIFCKCGFYLLCHVCGWCVYIYVWVAGKDLISMKGFCQDYVSRATMAGRKGWVRVSGTVGCLKNRETLLTHILSQRPYHLKPTDPISVLENTMILDCSHSYWTENSQIICTQIHIIQSCWPSLSKISN